jgi:all-trans-retinol dehydrogenase (NAD+)
MSVIRGATALVTGGASGIGLLTGRRLLEAGAARLVIWDIQDDAMQTVRDELGARNFTVDVRRVDVADPAQIEAGVRALEASGTAIDILVNNAGIVVGKSFADHSPVDIARTMEINALAPMRLTRALLPSMIARRRGHVVNIASAAGMVSNPGMSVYCASKWAVIGWSDSLRLEMERGRTGVRVTTVAPYYIDTGMFEGVRSRFLPILRPERVARDIVSAIAGDRIFLRLPRILDLLPLARGLMPTRVFDKVGGEWFGVYDTMTTFRGRR